MAAKIKVLFVCVHNSARSQMAEAFLKNMAGDRFEVESAGLEPTRINPLVVEAMKEEGFDLSANTTQSVFDLYKDGRLFDYVITVCDESNEAKCPVFPGISHRLHLAFEDPAALNGSEGERLAGIRRIRDEIKISLEQWLADFDDKTNSQGPFKTITRQA